jgi:biopolymer transport protein ExbB/TolQ
MLEHLAQRCVQRAYRKTQFAQITFRSIENTKRAYRQIAEHERGERDRSAVLRNEFSPLEFGEQREFAHAAPMSKRWYESYSRKRLTARIARNLTRLSFSSGTSPATYP